MPRPLRFSLVAALVFAGCGDDGGGMGDTDAAVGDATVDAQAETSVPDASLADAMLDAQVDSAQAADASPDAELSPECPTTAPDEGVGLMGACCYRKQNGEGATDIELRLAELDIQSPPALSGQVIGLLLRQALYEESFSWLLSISGADDDGAVTVTTGYGDRNGDHSFSYAIDNAPTANSSADRWNPVSFEGALSGEDIIGATDQNVTLPIGGRDQLVFELPLRGIDMNLKLSAMRSCVGAYSEQNGFDTGQGAFTTFVMVEDVSETTIALLGDISLCNFLGEIQSASNCEEVARTEWDNPPNALCNESGCTEDTDANDVCDPMVDCNAWRMSADFAAHGVEIK